MKKKICPYAAMCLMLLLSVTGCVYEYPELTPEGESGIDPTEVTVTADIILDMQLSEADKSRAGSRSPEMYRHRFVIDAYINRDLYRRHIVYADISENNRLNIPVTMKLHARDYQLVVWADYIIAGSEEDLFYNTEDIISIIGTTPYTGNTEYKDVQTASIALNLSEYRKQWGVKVPVRVNLERPVAHYKLITTDVQRYLTNNPGAAGKKHTVTIKYENYLPVGYNAYDKIPKHSYMYMQYSNTFTLPATGATEMDLSFDYLFASDDKPTQPVTIEIKNEKGEIVACTTTLIVNYVKGKSVIIRGPFLTTKETPGVGIDPGFDGEKEIKTEVTFL